MSVNIVKNSHVVVKPITFDVEYTIAPFLRSCPYQKNAVTLENLEVTLIRGLQPFTNNFEFEQGAIYDSKIVGAQQWISPSTKKSNIVIKLESQDLVDRRNELLKVNSDVASIYIPHMTLVYDVPNPTHETRWWVNDVINKFNQGPEGRYYGTTIRLSFEHAKDSVILENENEPVMVTKPF